MKQKMKGMKKVLFAALLLVGCVLTGCERTVYLATNVNYINLQVGDSCLLETYNMPKNHIIIFNASTWDYYSPEPQPDAICSLSNTQGTDDNNYSTMVYALKPGNDTITISYSYTVGIYAYGDELRIPVCVKE